MWAGWNSQSMKKPQTLACCSVTEEEHSSLLVPSRRVTHPVCAVPASGSPVKADFCRLQPSTKQTHLWSPEDSQIF